MTATREFATTFADAWQQFTERATTSDGQLIDQETREAKSSYIAFLIPVTGTSIVDATRPVREALTAADIGDVLPSHYFHITVLGIGLESALRTTPGSIARIMDRTSRALRDVQPITINLCGVNSFGNAAFVEVHDEAGGLKSLRDTLVHVLHQIGMPGFGDSALSGEGAPADDEAAHDRADAVNAPPFLPHMSFCYYREHYPAKKVAGVLDPFRETEFGTMRINYVTLAALTHSDFDRFAPITRIADLLIG